MNMLKKAAIVGTLAGCAIMLSLTSFAVTADNYYYCNGYAHSNGVCSGHAYHHSGTYVAPSANSTQSVPNINYNNTAYSVPTTTVTPSAPNYYYGGGHHGGRGGHCRW